ncbi:recombinase family protein [Streptomyces bauhiniae]|uniref:recombinase family protein n=1 Tax=Streptomyces bauhiniae TaxID=2340725 RepID=UPI0033B5C20F
MPDQLDPAHLDVVRVYLYARQSSARTDGSEVSTESQLAAGRALVAARSLQGVPWVIVGEFVDVGRSGWDPSVVRADFEKMMTGVRANEADVVIVNELSRLTRKGAHDALEIDKEFKAHGVRFMSVLEPFLDTSSPIGVAIFALIAALAKQDSDIKANRLRGAKQEIASVGGHLGMPPYGMRTVREQVGKLVVSVMEPDEDNPDHVDTVKRMIEMSFAGMSDNKIAHELESEEIPPPGLSERRATEKRKAAYLKRRLNQNDKTPLMWRPQTVHAVLSHPGIGGFAVKRVKRGKAYVNTVARDAAGKPLAPHRGIIKGARWLELQAKRNRLSTPERQPGTDVITPTLLSGWRFLSCGLCGGGMGQSTGGVKRNGKLAEPAYLCSNPRGHGGLGIRRAALDEYVARRVWARLATADMDDERDRDWVAAAAQRFALQHDLAGVANDRRETVAHLEHVQRSITELQADRQAGLYKGRAELETWRATVQQYRDYEAECEARIAELDEKAATQIRVPAEWFSGEDPLAKDSVWAAWSVYEQREFLAFFLDGVQVGRGRDPETRKLVPVEERATLTWAELDKDEDANEEAAELAGV